MCNVFIPLMRYGVLVVKKMTTKEKEKPTHEGCFMGALGEHESLSSHMVIPTKLYYEILEKLTCVHELVILVHVFLGGVN